MELGQGNWIGDARRKRTREMGGGVRVCVCVGGCVLLGRGVGDRDGEGDRGGGLLPYVHTAKSLIGFILTVGFAITE